MDFRSLPEVQQQLFQRLIEKLMTRNGANNSSNITGNNNSSNSNNNNSNNGLNSGIGQQQQYSNNNNNNNLSVQNPSSVSVSVKLPHAAIEPENLKKLLSVTENVRDVQAMQAVMEKLKENNQHIDLDIIEDNYKNGEFWEW